MLLFVSVFFSVCFDVVSLKAQKKKRNHCFFICVWYWHKMFIFALSFFTRLFCSVYVGVLFVYCLCAYHCFFSSDRNKAWPGGNCPYLLIAYWSLSPYSPHVKHRTLLLSPCSSELRHPPSQDVWDMTLPSSLFPFFPVTNKNPLCPNIGTSRWKDNIGNAA